MLGRVRPSSSPLECLELERSPTKVIKYDSLSIYEATLVKLRQGSQRDLLSSSGVEHAMKVDVSCNSAGNFPNEEAMTTDSNCCPTSISSSSSDCQPTGTSKEQPKQTMSIIHMFEKYKSFQHALSSPNEAVNS